MTQDVLTGQLVLFGGGLTPWDDTWVWTGTAWNQKVPSTVPPARYNAVMAYDSARKQVVMFGGASLNDTWVWDGSNWIQKTPATSPSKRQGFDMVYDALRNQVVLFGGHDGTRPLSDTWVWDGTNWTQRAPATVPPARWLHAMAYDSARGHIVMHGGQHLNDTWIWDGSNWIKKLPSAAPPAHTLDQTRMAFDPIRSQIVTFTADARGETWVWDGTNWSQKFPSVRPPVNRGGYAMAYHSGSGKVVLFGGWGVTASGLVSMNGTWGWDGNNWSQLAQDNGPPESVAASLAQDPGTGKVLLFGGASYNTLHNDTWTWEGTRWQRLTPANRPSGRYYQQMVYDAARRQVVMFSGVVVSAASSTGFALINETWIWDGVTWTQRFPATSPSPRHKHAMAYDAARQQVVLFGGADDNGALNDTWVWTGDNWVKKTPANSPSARSGHAMAYDAVRQQIVMFGGFNLVPLPETWVWDGNNWTNKAPANRPPDRADHAMTFDPTRGKVVLFGGGVQSARNDTWSWNGTTWTEESVTNRPPRLYTVAMGTSASGEVVLFGGYDGSGRRHNTTWVYASYTATFDRTSASVGANAASGTFSITVDPPTASWVAVSSEPWLTITSGASGKGSGLISFAAAPNTGVARSATITVGGTVFTVNQAAYGAAPGIPPAVTSVTPFAGTGPGATFTLVYSDDSGWGDLQMVSLLINPQLETNNGCYVELVVASNSVRLRNNTGTAWIGPSSIGTGQPLGNSQCTVNPQASSALGSGNTLTLNLSISFAPTFTGKKRLYMQAVDNGGLSSPWFIMGNYWPTAVGQIIQSPVINRYRLYNPFSRSHLHTTDLNEYNVLGTRGFLQEGVGGRIFDGPAAAGGVQATPIYRLYNMRDVRHFWTTDRNEYLTLMMRFPNVFLGEGADGMILTSGAGNAIPLHRLLFNFSQVPIIHHWTADQHEVSVLTGSGSWKSEGIAAYIFPPGGPVVLNGMNADEVIASPTTEFHSRTISTREPVLVGAVSAAALEKTSAAPGSLMRLLGYTLRTVRSVDFDDIPAQIVSVADNEVTVVVPDEVRGKERVTIQATLDGGLRLSRPLALTDGNPAIFATDFTGRGEAQAQNQDGMPNSRQRPASRGSLLTFEATGISSARDDITVTVGGYPAEVVSVNQSPSPGRVLVCIRIPAEAQASASSPLMMRTGGSYSQPGVLIAVE